MTEQKLQEKYILYQLLNQNLESLKQQMEMVAQQSLEVRSTMLSIDDIKGIKDENEVFLPLGSGCYGKGKITSRNDVLVNTGAGIFMNQKAEQARLSLEEREKELQKASETIKEQIERVVKQLNGLGLEIQHLAQQKSKS
jgi:prefoldin alpha subunit